MWILSNKNFGERFMEVIHFFPTCICPLTKIRHIADGDLQIGHIADGDLWMRHIADGDLQIRNIADSDLQKRQIADGESDGVIRLYQILRFLKIMYEIYKLTYPDILQFNCYYIEVLNL